jgi:uncharacterized lipoprotein YmbA
MIKTITLFSSALRDKREGLGCLMGLGFALFLAGCSILPTAVEDPTRYYLLGSAPGAEPPAVSPKGALHLGIRAVDLPIYLRNTRAMVVRTGANEIRYQDIARWAEPLDQAVQHAVRERLQASEAVAGAEVAPFSTEVHRDFNVIVRVLQCEGSIQGQGRKVALFSATYEILDERNGGGPAIRKTFSAPPSDWDGKDFGALAARLSEDATALGNDISASLPK